MINIINKCLIFCLIFFMSSSFKIYARNIQSSTHINFKGPATELILELTPSISLDELKWKAKLKMLEFGRAHTIDMVFAIEQDGELYAINTNEELKQLQHGDRLFVYHSERLRLSAIAVNRNKLEIQLKKEMEDINISKVRIDGVPNIPKMEDSWARNLPVVKAIKTDKAMKILITYEDEIWKLKSHESHSTKIIATKISEFFHITTPFEMVLAKPNGRLIWVPKTKQIAEIDSEDILLIAERRNSLNIKKSDEIMAKIGIWNPYRTIPKPVSSEENIILVGSRSMPTGFFASRISHKNDSHKQRFKRWYRGESLFHKGVYLWGWSGSESRFIISDLIEIISSLPHVRVVFCLEYDKRIVATWVIAFLERLRDACLWKIFPQISIAGIYEYNSNDTVWWQVADQLAKKYASPKAQILKVGINNEESLKTFIDNVLDYMPAINYRDIPKIKNPINKEEPYFESEINRNMESQIKYCINAVRLYLEQKFQLATLKIQGNQNKEKIDDLEDVIEENALILDKAIEKVKTRRTFISAIHNYI